MVGARGFEPPTPTTPLWCATRLRYAPTVCLERQVVLAAQDVKKLLEFHAYLFDDLLTLGYIRLRILASQPLSCATNRKTIIIQEATYLTNDQNVLTLIITTIAAPFHRF